MTARPIREILDPGRYGASGYPHALWARLRREEPLSWFEGGETKPFWAVVRHAEVVRISADPETFLSAPRIIADMVHPSAVRARHLLNMDPPEHGAHRALVARRFGGAELARLEPRVRALAASAVARLGPAPEDWARDLAAVLPLTLTAELLGLDAREHPRLLAWAHRLSTFSEPDRWSGCGARDSYREAEGELFETFARLLDERRETPGEDLLTVLLDARLDGRPLSQDDLLSFCLLLVTAGVETTMAAICGGALALAEHPEQYARLRADPGLIPTAVEEIVRWTSPVVHFCRTPLRDVELAGQQVKRGQTLALFYPSANRDAEVFGDPDTFRLDRAPNPHVGFGTGPHYCLGAQLARLQLRAFLGALIERVSRIHVAGPVLRVRSTVIGAYRALPLRCEIGQASVSP